MEFANVIFIMKNNCGETVPGGDIIELADWLDNAFVFADIENLTDEQIGVFARAMRNAYYLGQENK